MKYLPRGLGQICRLLPERAPLVTSLANGFKFAALKSADRTWLRRRQLVNQTGTVTAKGREWASELLAREADELMAGNVCLDFME